MSLSFVACPVHLIMVVIESFRVVVPSCKIGVQVLEVFFNLKSSSHLWVLDPVECAHHWAFQSPTMLVEKDPARMLVGPK